MFIANYYFFCGLPILIILRRVWKGFLESLDVSGTRKEKGKDVLSKNEKKGTFTTLISNDALVVIIGLMISQ